MAIENCPAALLLPRIVLWIHVVDTPRAYTINLDDGFFASPDEVIDLGNLVVGGKLDAEGNGTASLSGPSITDVFAQGGSALASSHLRSAGRTVM